MVPDFFFLLVFSLSAFVLLCFQVTGTQGCGLLLMLKCRHHGCIQSHINLFRGKNRHFTNIGIPLSHQRNTKIKYYFSNLSYFSIFFLLNCMSVCICHYQDLLPFEFCTLAAFFVEQIKTLCRWSRCHFVLLAPVPSCYSKSNSVTEM